MKSIKLVVLLLLAAILGCDSKVAFQNPTSSSEGVTSPPSGPGGGLSNPPPSSPALCTPLISTNAGTLICYVQWTMPPVGLPTLAECQEIANVTTVELKLVVALNGAGVSSGAFVISYRNAAGNEIYSSDELSVTPTLNEGDAGEYFFSSQQGCLPTQNQNATYLSSLNITANLGYSTGSEQCSVATVSPWSLEFGKVWGVYAGTSDFNGTCIFN